MKTLLLALLVLAVVREMLHRPVHRTPAEERAWARWFMAHPNTDDEDCVSEGLDWHSMQGKPRRPKGHRLG